MSHTSTSNSEGKGRFKPEAIVEIPRTGWAWWRWIVPLLMVLAAEGAVRVALAMRWVEQPTLYGQMHLDRKVDTFRHAFLPLDEPGTRYLIAGSSMPNTNIDPRRISATLAAETGEPWSGFNGAFYAGRYDDLYFFLDWYYDQWEFEHLVITFEPWGMRPGGFETLQKRLSAPPFERWLDNHSKLFAIRNQMQVWDHSIDINQRGHRALDVETTIYGWVRTIGDLPNKREVAERQAADMMNRTVTPPQKFDLNWPGAARVQRWAAERNITLWWVIQPTVPVLEEIWEPEYKYEHWRRLAEERLLTVPNNHLLDLKDLEGTLLTEDDFFDANHLNPRGSATYSVELGRRWAAALKNLGTGK